MLSSRSPDDPGIRGVPTHTPHALTLERSSRCASVCTSPWEMRVLPQSKFHMSLPLMAQCHSSTLQFPTIFISMLPVLQHSYFSSVFALIFSYLLYLGSMVDCPKSGLSYTLASIYFWVDLTLAFYWVSIHSRIFLGHLKHAPNISTLSSPHFCTNAVWFYPKGNYMYVYICMLYRWICLLDY